MNNRVSRRLKWSDLRGIFALGLAAALVSLPAGSAHAFEYPLSETQIRNAYFLGSGGPAKRRTFLKNYIRYLPVPPSGPQVALIEVDTPLARIVQTVASHPFEYHAPDAEEKFLGRPGEFRVRVQILITPTYPAKTTDMDHFWKDFTVRLVQNGQEIRARSIHGTPIYDYQTTLGYIGANLRAEFNPAAIQSEPATVEVDTPDGQRVRSTFDLATLQ